MQSILSEKRVAEPFVGTGDCPNEETLLQEQYIGRGWTVLDYETDLEPLFPESLRKRGDRPVDDGRLPSFYRRFLSKRRKAPPTDESLQPSVSSSSRIQLNAKPVSENVSFRVYLPHELKYSSEQTEQLLLTLALSASVAGFEIVGTDSTITLQFTCPSSEGSSFLSQLRAHLPNINIRDEADALAECLLTSRVNESVMIDFGLGREWFLPIHCPGSFAIDPLLPLIAGLEELKADEAVCLQILFCRTRQDWQRLARQIALDQSRKPGLAQLQLPGIKEKISDPLFATQIRLVVQSSSQEQSLRIARKTKAFFSQFSAPNGNELIPLKNDGLDPHKHLDSFLKRTTFRPGFLISAGELSTIVHLPSDEIKSSKLTRSTDNTKLAPDFATSGNVILGENQHAGQTRLIRLANEQRLKHIWITGASGCGKSTLITNLAEQDALMGNGFVVLDPHDLINHIMPRIPENRLDDVVLIDPADQEFPVGFNPLSANSELERTLLASDLVAIFQTFWTSQGDIMTNVLHNSIITFLESTRGGTLTDLRLFLVDRNFRNQFLETVPDEGIRFYWTNEFPSLAKRIIPLLTRLDLFLRSKIVRNILTQKDNKLDFRRIMDERKILLVKLTHGAIGEENSRLLGSLIIAKLYQSAISRQNVAEEDRPSCFVYLDEAHHYFSIPSTSLLLSGGRKYGISLLASHQDTQQIANADVLSSLTTNTYTRICFRSDTDAERIAKGLSFFTADHLKNLGVGEAICRFEQSRFDFNLKTFPLKPVDPKIAGQRIEYIVNNTRKNYARSRSEVETDLQTGRNIIRGLSISSHSTPPDRTDSESVNTYLEMESVEAADSLALEASINILPPKRGQGGRHHQELQAVIKRMAETNGLLAEIEKPILDGRGQVDVSIESEKIKIAAEVCVTTADYETHNAQKCLTAGYDHVVIVVSNQKKIPLIKRKLQAEIPVDLAHKVRACSLMDLLAFLRQLTGSDQPSRKGKQSSGRRLTLSEACELLGKAPSTLYRWLNEGRIPFYRVGREYQFDRDELLLLGKHNLSAKRKPVVNLPPLTIEKSSPKTRKRQDERYRKLLGLTKIEGPLRTRREKEAK